MVSHHFGVQLFLGLFYFVVVAVAMAVVVTVVMVMVMIVNYKRGGHFIFMMVVTVVGAVRVRIIAVMQLDVVSQGLFRNKVLFESHIRHDL